MTLLTTKQVADGWVATARRSGDGSRAGASRRPCASARILCAGASRMSKRGSTPARAPAVRNWPLHHRRDPAAPMVRPGTVPGRENNRRDDS